MYKKNQKEGDILNASIRLAIITKMIDVHH